MKEKSKDGTLVENKIITNYNKTVKKAKNYFSVTLSFKKREKGIIL